MATYADMRARIADELANDGDITSAQINNAIQSAIRNYEAEGFWFNQKVATFSTVSGQEYYDSAALADIPDMVTIYAMRIMGSGSGVAPIAGIDNETIEDSQDGTVTGEPRFYTRFENKIRLFPIPSAVYSVRVSYVYKLAALVNDTDSNAWTNECEELIRQAAKKRLCLDILLADDMAARCAMMEKAAYDDVRKENRLRSPQQTLRADLPFSRRYFGYSRYYG